jgi:hypothetical protein
MTENAFFMTENAFSMANIIFFVWITIFSKTNTAVIVAGISTARPISR